MLIFLPNMGFILALGIPGAICIGIYKAYRRRKFMRLMDERNRLFDSGDRDGSMCVQQQIKNLTKKLQPSYVKELEQWYSEHSEYMQEQRREAEKQQRETAAWWKNHRRDMERIHDTYGD